MSRVELCEVQVQEDSDDEGQSSRSRYQLTPFMVECVLILPDLQ